jgi:hypothetical protein
MGCSPDMAQGGGRLATRGRGKSMSPNSPPPTANIVAVRALSGTGHQPARRERRDAERPETRSQQPRRIQNVFPLPLGEGQGEGRRTFKCASTQSRRATNAPASWCGGPPPLCVCCNRDCIFPHTRCLLTSVSRTWFGRTIAINFRQPGRSSPISLTGGRAG